jgi:hypothetical protein
MNHCSPRPDEFFGALGHENSIIKNHELSIELYDKLFNELIVQVYKQNQNIDKMIFDQNNWGQAKTEILGRRCMDALELKHLSELSKNEGQLTHFKTVAQICIPMTLPVKFVIAQSNKYHFCRNLFKELDQYLNIAQKTVFSDNKIESIRK